MSTPRTIVYEEKAWEALVEMYGGTELADVAVIGFDFVLARDPTKGWHIDNGMCMIEMVGEGIWVPAVAYYTYDKQYVFIHDIVPTDN
jgi:hypothetical protein